MNSPHQEDRSTRRWMSLGAILVMTALLPVLAACGGDGGAATGTTPVTTDVPGQIPEAGSARGDAGTIAFVVIPTWNGTDPTNVPLMAKGSPDQTSNLLTVLKNGSYLRSVFTDSAGQEHAIGIPIDSWQAGEQHAITVTWGSGVEQMWVDGKLVGQLDDGGSFELRPGDPLALGSGLPPAVPGANGTITDVQAYGRPLTPDEIATFWGSEPPPAAQLSVQSTSVATPESAGTVCVELVGGAGLVAGTQNDLAWDPSCVEISEPCEADPQHGRSVFTAQRGGPRLRALVFSLINTDPIDDGILYCCPFHIASLRSGTCCAVSVQGAYASDSVGRGVVTAGVDGQICLR